jgi:hypothetical protein
MSMKYDLLTNEHCPTRIAYNLTEDQTQQWLSERGYRVVSEWRAGLYLTELTVEYIRHR